jgi:hypothetical protein
MTPPHLSAQDLWWIEPTVAVDDPALEVDALQVEMALSVLLLEERSDVLDSLSDQLQDCSPLHH